MITRERCSLCHLAEHAAQIPKSSRAARGLRNIGRHASGDARRNELSIIGGRKSNVHCSFDAERNDATNPASIKAIRAVGKAAYRLTIYPLSELPNLSCKTDGHFGPQMTANSSAGKTVHTQFPELLWRFRVAFGTTTGVFKMSKENQNKSSGQQDKNKEVKGEDKKLKTMEPGDDPNDVAPSGVGGKQR
jgi:hypothetical protein